ncbi:MAG: hypothetical protein M1831_003342 [Alyxoria varia]|nr:MAG: hypothetical protein M1831_003342 [Alyxoria varia]
MTDNPERAEEMLENSGIPKEDAQLARKHWQYDLEPADRDSLKSAMNTLKRSAFISGVIGLGLATALTFRFRQSRAGILRSFHSNLAASDKPARLIYESGREEAVHADLPRAVRPSSVGAAFSYGLAGFAGFTLFADLGGTIAMDFAKREVERDEGRKERIERAFRGWNADMLRKRADEMDKGEGSPFPLMPRRTLF